MNSQMNNRLTVNDEGVQCMIGNNSAMYYNNQMIIAQNVIYRLVNAIKAYLAKQEDYFHAEYVMKRGRKLISNPDGAPIALGRESVLVYVELLHICTTSKRHLD
ncbi:hypothetical protein G6F70_002734 [Rhizopus microsporus]|nr:hypothetical protein G6F70_002734 [Rhizopus microsporus]KAG1207535.1 hypothetical protein G6F69_007962 [Rhizopus microsporus]KAG1228332.1 hypothetical protein G6F67_007882 [Rhizopus microsporus]